ncbi:MAG: tetratricopeptide repeat protein [Pseudomonadota bacterium]
MKNVKFTSRQLFLSALMLLALGPAGADEVSDTAGHLLAAELALNEQDYRTAAEEYRQAAELSDQVDVARQATEVAFVYGFNDDALASADRWLELSDNSEEALLYLARIQMRLESYRAARRSFRQLIEGEQAEDRLLLLIGVLLEEDPKQSDKIMRSLTRPYKESAKAHYAAAVMALAAEDNEHAVKRAQQAIELEPDWLRPHLLYSRALLLDGKHDEAIDYTARLIGDDPEPNPDARVELAIMMMSVGRDEDALSQVNQVLLEQSGNFDALRLMAIINFRLRHFDAAQDDFEDLYQSGRHTMEALYYLARIADFREDYERAIRLYMQVEAGQHALAARRRGSALIAFEQEDPSFALQKLDEFAQIAPASAIDVTLARAQLLSMLERYDESLAAYEQYLGFRGEDEAAMLGKAELLLRMDRLDDALATYRAALERWPESALTLNALGYTLADRTEQYEEAAELIEKALQKEPDSPAIIDSWGWVLYKLGHHEEALVELQRAYLLFDDAEVAAHIVEVLAVLERHDEALEVLEKAEAKQPDSRFLKDVRERFFPAAE